MYQTALAKSLCACIFKNQLYLPQEMCICTYFFSTGFCITETDRVTVRVECPGSETIPGIDGFLCSLDGGNFFACKRDLSVCDDVFCDGVVFCFCMSFL